MSETEKKMIEMITEKKKNCYIKLEFPGGFKWKGRGSGRGDVGKRTNTWSVWKNPHGNLLFHKIYTHIFYIRYIPYIYIYPSKYLEYILYKIYGIMLLPETIDCLITSSVPHMAYLPLSCWSGHPGDCLQTIQAIAFALGCPAELDGKDLLLKIPHALVTGHVENLLVLTRKLLSYFIVFIVVECVLGCKKSPTILASCEPNNNDWPSKIHPWVW